MPQIIPRSAAKISSAALACLLPIVFVAVKRCFLPKYGAEWIVALFFAIFLYMVLHQIEKPGPGYTKRCRGSLRVFRIPSILFTLR
jgi:hypothetical protein